MRPFRSNHRDCSLQSLWVKHLGWFSRQIRPSLLFLALSTLLNFRRLQSTITFFAKAFFSIKRPWSRSYKKHWIFLVTFTFKKKFRYVREIFSIKDCFHLKNLFYHMIFCQTLGKMHTKEKPDILKQYTQFRVQDFQLNFFSVAHFNKGILPSIVN